MLGQQPDEQRGGKTDDVQVVALDPAHEPRAAALDRIGACAALPFAGGQVVVDLPRGQRTELHTGRVVLEQLDARAEEAEPEITSCSRPARAASISRAPGSSEGLP